MSNPIRIQNRKLAEGLISIGASFAPGAEGGPTLNIYTPGLLRAKGIIDRPVTETIFERRVIETAKAGIYGAVEFVFERTKQAEDFIAEWDKTADAIRRHREWQQMSAGERDGMPEAAALPDIPDAIVAQALCAHANNMKSIKGIEFANPPICSTLTGSETTGKTKTTSTGVSTGEIHGAGKTWSVNLSDEKRADLKIHPQLK